MILEKLEQTLIKFTIICLTQPVEKSFTNCKVDKYSTFVAHILQLRFESYCPSDTKILFKLKFLGCVRLCVLLSNKFYKFIGKITVLRPKHS